EGVTPRGWYDTLYLSSKATWDEAQNDPNLRKQDHYHTLEQGLTEGESHTFTGSTYVYESIDDDTAMIYLYAHVDRRTYGSGSINEFLEGTDAEGNNFLPRTGPISIGWFDLAATMPVDPLAARTGHPVDVAWTVQNNGNVATSAMWTDRIYLSTDDSPTVSAGDILLANVNRPRDLEGHIDPDPVDTYDQAHPVTIPEWKQEWEGVSTFYLKVLTDALDQVEEDDQPGGSNWAIRPLDLTKEFAPDLRVTDVSNPGTLVGGQSLDVTYTLQNAGDLDVTGRWHDTLHLVNNSGSALHPPLADVRHYTTNSVEGATNEEWKDMSVPIPAGRHTVAWVFYRTESYTNLNDSAAVDDIVLPLVGGDQTINFDDGQLGALSSSVGAPPDETPDWDAATGAAATRPLAVGDRVVLSYTGDFEAGDVTYKINVDGHYLAFYVDYALPAGEERQYTTHVAIPSALAGTGFKIRVITDHSSSWQSNDLIHEPGYEDNNTGDSTAFDINQAPYPDLKVTAVTRPSPVLDDDVRTGKLVTIQWTVQNENLAYTGANASGLWTDRVFFSANTVFGDDDDVTIDSVSHQGGLVDGASYTAEAVIRLPDGTDATKHVFVQTDVQNSVHEVSLEGNNVSSSLELVVHGSPYPDLKPFAITAPDSIDNGSILTAYLKIENAGDDVASGRWHDYIYLSTDDILDGGDNFLAKGKRESAGLPFTTDELDPKFYTNPVEIRIPREISGLYYLIMKTDADDVLFENNPQGPADAAANNVFARPVEITVAPSPNLIIEAASIEDLGRQSDGQYELTVHWTVKNIGNTSTGTAHWHDRLFLSTTPHQYGDKYPMKKVPNQAYLEPEQSYTQTNAFTVPWEFAAGSYYLLVQTDSDDEVYEYQGENDNYGSGTTSSGSPVDIEFRIQPLPYLSIVSSYSGPGADANPDARVPSPQDYEGEGPHPDDIYLTKEIYAPGERIYGNWTSRNTGNANTNSSGWGGWDDAMALSVDPYYDRNGDIWLGSHLFHRAGVLPPYRGQDGTV
ncbi:MAG: hypothetical protein HON70_14205, partial [Lentisphaerae bacterium]|nr:hypothetical protein [Lentisphaerota bacterium]